MARSVLSTLLLTILLGVGITSLAVAAGEFRIVDWNAGGSDPKWNKGRDKQVALFVLYKVKVLNANVITLQEVTDATHRHLVAGLGPGWTCHARRFGMDNIATCVKGTARKFRWKRLWGERYSPDVDWWGYIQLEYNGVQITNVHTRAHWADRHVAELHDDVKTGIVAGDFNHTNPGWHQTDRDLEATWQNDKIDHVLTVEKPWRAWGDAQEKGGSNHCVLLTKVTLGPGYDRYAALWLKRNTDGMVARHGLNSAQYQRAFNSYVKQGYRLTYVSGYAINGSALYAAIWEKQSGPPWVARHGMSASQYQAEFDTYVKQGYRLHQVSGYNVGGQDRYAAIWVKTGGPAWVARHRMTGAKYQQEFHKWTNQGYRLTHVSGYSIGSQAYYAAIWQKSSGPAWVARHGMSSAKYQQEFNQWTKRGYRLSHVSGYKAGGQLLYAAIWSKGRGPAWVAHHGMTSPEYQSFFNQYSKQGYRLARVSGYSTRP